MASSSDTKTKVLVALGAAALLMTAMGHTISDYLGHPEQAPATKVESVQKVQLSQSQIDRNIAKTTMKSVERKTDKLNLSPKQIEAFKIAAHKITPKMEASAHVSQDQASAYNERSDAEMQSKLLSEASYDPAMQSVLAAARALGDDATSVQQLASQIVQTHKANVEAQAAKDAARTPSPTEAYDAAKIQNHREAGVNGPMGFPTPG